MGRTSRAAEIDDALLAEVDSHPSDLVRVVCDQLGLTRPAVLGRLHHLVAQGYLTTTGSTRPLYERGINHRRLFRYTLAGLSEDTVWTRDVRPLLDGLARNVLDICQHGFTEMLNNAIDHSAGKSVDVYVDLNKRRVVLAIADDGVGIFRKITRHLRLPDERLALLELSKGKLTTDPENHSGEGVFFSSRMFDTFQIISGELVFDHRDAAADDILVEAGMENRGTTVLMEIARNSKRTVNAMFRQYSSGPDDYSFARTVVPVRLMRLGDENLISRSQAKRVLERVDRFRTVVMDFAAVDSIGQAFADEIFRVFANAHPKIELIPIHAKSGVQQMINRVLTAQIAPLKS